MSLFFKFRSGWWWSVQVLRVVAGRRFRWSPCEELRAAAPGSLGGSDRGRDLEPRQFERGGVWHGVRSGGAGGGLPRAPRPRAPRALAHRALTRQVRPARQLQRQGRSEGAAREVPDGQVRQPPDGADPQAPRRRDVAVRRAAEVVRHEGGRRRGGRGRGGQLAGGGGGHRRAAGHGQRRAPPPTPHDFTS